MMMMSSLPWGRFMMALSSLTCRRRLGKCRWVEVVSHCLPPRATEFLYLRLSEFSGNGIFNFQNRYRDWTSTHPWELSLHWFHIGQTLNWLGHHCFGLLHYLSAYYQKFIHNIFWYLSGLYINLFLKILLSQIESRKSKNWFKLAQKNPLG